MGGGSSTVKSADTQQHVTIVKSISSTDQSEAELIAEQQAQQQAAAASGGGGAGGGGGGGNSSSGSGVLGGRVLGTMGNVNVVNSNDARLASNAIHSASLISPSLFKIKSQSYSIGRHPIC
jgi:hypothetical protein